jgi:drug/metabolite transporter (DMT)-like permease
VTIAIAIAMVAALLVGTGLVLQQHAAERVPKSSFLRLRLIAELLHQRRWLAGIAIMAVGQILWAWTLGHLDLTFAEPLLATELIFALIVAVPLTGQRPRKSELLGALLLIFGVSAISYSRSVNSEGVHFGSGQYWWAAAAIGAIALLLVRAGLRRTSRQRATLTGIAAGLIFGIADALTRRTVEIISSHSLLTALSSWPAYCVLAASLIGLWLMENSFNAAPLHASLPAITAAEPVTGILLGIVVFGDVVRISTGMLAFQAAGLAALVTGVVLVARAPALSSLRPSHILSRPARPSGPDILAAPLPQLAGAEPGEPLLGGPDLGQPLLGGADISASALGGPATGGLLSAGTDQAEPVPGGPDPVLTVLTGPDPVLTGSTGVQPATSPLGRPAGPGNLLACWCGQPAVVGVAGAGCLLHQAR